MFPATHKTGVVFEDFDIQLFESAYEVFSCSPSMLNLSDTKPMSSTCNLNGEQCEGGLYISESATKNILNIVKCAINAVRQDYQEHYKSILPIVDFGNEDTTAILELIGGEMHHDRELEGRFTLFTQSLALCLAESAVRFRRQQ